jgi:hypothetical protein
VSGQKEKLVPAMSIEDIEGWLDEEIAYLNRLVANKGEGVQAVVGFTVEYLEGMKTNLKNSVEQAKKP